MEQNCDIVRDLLPLYTDGACSEASAEYVRAHLEKCKSCAALAAEMSETSLEDEMAAEEEGVILRQARKLRRRGVIAGCIVAGICVVPVIVCLIVNLATEPEREWFSIVLAALLLTASVTSVPLLVPDHKFLWSVASGVASLLLLLGTCAIFSRGDWFPVAASASVFGLSVVLLPIVVHCQPIRGLLGKQKGIACLAVDTLLYVGMMLCIGVFSDSDTFGTLAFGISLPIGVLVFCIFAVLRYLPGGLLKTGACFALLGVFAFFAEFIIGALISSPVPLPRFVLPWNARTEDGNLKWCILIGGILVGVILTTVSLIQNRKRRK